jgi:hypothetical protein
VAVQDFVVVKRILLPPTVIELEENAIFGQQCEPAVGFTFNRGGSKTSPGEILDESRACHRCVPESGGIAGLLLERCSAGR